MPRPAPWTPAFSRSHDPELRTSSSIGIRLSCKTNAEPEPSILEQFRHRPLTTVLVMFTNRAKSLPVGSRLKSECFAAFIGRHRTRQVTSDAGPGLES